MYGSPTPKNLDFAHDGLPDSSHPVIAPSRLFSRSRSMLFGANTVSEKDANTTADSWDSDVNAARVLYGVDSILPAGVSIADAADGYTLAALLVAREGTCNADEW